MTGNCQVRFLGDGRSGNISSVTRLLPTQFNLDINLKNVADLEESPLHLACKNNRYDFAEAFLSYGARVNEPTKNGGATPCMLAAGAAGDVVPLLTLLVEDFKANINLTDNNGLSALKYAEDCGNQGAVTYLMGVHNGQDAA
jgi:ankyrin repeat protein